MKSVIRKKVTPSLSFKKQETDNDRLTTSNTNSPAKKSPKTKDITTAALVVSKFKLSAKSKSSANTPVRKKYNYTDANGAPMCGATINHSYTNCTPNTSNTAESSYAGSPVKKQRGQKPANKNTLLSEINNQNLHNNNNSPSSNSNNIHNNSKSSPTKKVSFENRKNLINCSYQDYAAQTNSLTVNRTDSFQNQNSNPHQNHSSANCNPESHKMSLNVNAYPRSDTVDFKRDPVNLTCVYCRRQTNSRVELELCWKIYVLVPLTCGLILCIDRLKEAVHYCQRCGQVVGYESCFGDTKVHQQSGKNKKKSNDGGLWIF